LYLEIQQVTKVNKKNLLFKKNHCLYV